MTYWPDFGTASVYFWVPVRSTTQSDKRYVVPETVFDVDRLPRALVSADDGGRISSENGTIAILEVYLLWSAQITTLIRSVAAALRS